MLYFDEFATVGHLEFGKRGGGAKPGFWEQSPRHRRLRGSGGEVFIDLGTETSPQPPTNFCGFHIKITLVVAHFFIEKGMQ